MNRSGTLKSNDRKSFRWTCSVALVLILSTAGIAFGETLSTNPVDFVSVLLRQNAYLFEESTRVQLDSLNRDLREAAKLLKEGATGEEGDEAAATIRRAEQRLRTLLQDAPSTIPLDFRAGVPGTFADAPVPLPGSVGGLLFRIARGEEETGYFTLDYTMAVTERSGPIPIEVAPSGTTFALVNLTEVPVGRTSLLFEFRGEGVDPVRWPLDIRTPQPARLKVNVLSADTGKPTAAMVRLTWKTNGLDYKPSNAVDLTSQFDGQGNTSSRRPAFLPGRLRGEYWCVPGPFDMAVPPGEWEIVIRRGLEHIPVFDNISVAEGRTIERTYKPRRWVDMPQFGWFSGDDHVHSRILSDDDAERLMIWLRAEDLHLANVAKMGDVNRTYFEQRGFGPQYRVVSDDYILSPGQEGPRTHSLQRLGHVLAMNITSMVRDTDRYFLYDWVVETIRKQGGLVGYAHGQNYHHANRDMSINIPRSKVDFVEILQVGVLGTEIYYEILNLGFELTASAGSDTPFAGTVGEERFTADSWFEAVERGRTFVTNGPMIEFSVDGALPGDEIAVDQETLKLGVRARAWGDPERTTPTRLEIVLHGEVIHQVDSNKPSQKELAVDFTLEAGNGFWIAARAEGSDGSYAHTTPVYVVRKPLRFWKHEKAGSLIDKRLSALAEVREMVAEARANPASNEDTETNNWQWWQRKRLSEQGPELLEHVEAAQRIYEELRQTHAQEQAVRAAGR